LDQLVNGLFLQSAPPTGLWMLKGMSLTEIHKPVSRTAKREENTGDG